MPRRAAGLTAAKVRTAKPGRYGDGNGLYLLVRTPAARFWLFRFTSPRTGKLREMGLGKADADGARGGVTLAEAREKASELRRVVKAGVDPLERQAEAEAAAAAEAEAAEIRSKTFDAVAALYLEAHRGAWKNAKHRDQWPTTMRQYASPHFGSLPVSEIDTAHVTAALRSIWQHKTETASRLRGRIEAVLDYATVLGWRAGANPARWRGHLDKVFPRRTKVQPIQHHPALPWQEVPAFMAALRGQDWMAARALEFCVLTAARSGEVLGARWPEIDMNAGVWVVPKERMKAGREHRVALSGAALAVLRQVAPLRPACEPDPLVFPGRFQGRPLSHRSMAAAVRRMGRKDEFTVHGFRSAFRDWAGETTAHPREVVEAALAHRLGDRVEQAYARGDLFQKRRRLMEDWGAFCAKAPANVLPIATAGAALEETA
jgi:integrase